MKKYGIKIDVRSSKSLYITINGMIFYLEHSEVAPMYVSCWDEGSIEDDVIHLKPDSNRKEEGVE